MKDFLKLTCYLAGLLGAVRGEGYDPRDVTVWNFEERSIQFSSSKMEGRADNSTLVDWGLTIPNGTAAVPCSEGDQCLDYGIAKVVVTYDENCERIVWTTDQLQELKDCVNLLGHWYGGGQQVTQPWPIETNPRKEVPFVTADMLGMKTMYGGLSERYWISSEGVAVKVDDTIPLFLSVPDNDNDGIADQLCFSSRYDQPFASETPDVIDLSYYLCFDEDVRQVYDSTFSKFYASPSNIPDERMMTDPVWSTWAEYFTSVDQPKVISLAQAIIDNGFNNSQIEIDDNWETCYGDALFNPDKFPYPKLMVDELHLMDFRVTLWIHPFINTNCESFAFADQNGYFIKNATGQTQLTSWWQGNNAGIIDFSNTDAVTWWSSRLDSLRTDIGIDSFKFDAGESSWLPEDYTLSLPEEYWPNGYTTAYVNSVKRFGNMIEVRVGSQTQEAPVFVRMLDKDSKWGYDNGLATVIPSLLHSSLLGYPYVLPDMIGGNGYGINPSAELFIRWVQANTFMPSLQFSIVPWGYGDNSDLVVNISQQATALHASYSSVFIELAANATQGLGPMARPTWWLCPKDENCLLADQQFLLGNNILAAPVVYRNGTAIDVVFPPGSWSLEGSGEIYEGPSKQTVTGLDIYSNVYFTRV